jgi:hypothetical protein
MSSLRAYLSGIGHWDGIIYRKVTHRSSKSITVVAIEPQQLKDGESNKTCISSIIPKRSGTIIKRPHLR